MKYKYNLRTGYDTAHLLIEFTNITNRQHFVTVLFEAINELNPLRQEVVDMWMNDEMLIKVNCDIGKFDLSIDIWGLAFIFSNESQDCITRVFSILNVSSSFVEISTKN